MPERLFGRFTPVTNIFFLLLFAFAGLFLFMILGVLACMLIFGITDITQLLSPSIATPQGISILRVMQMFHTTGLFIFPPVLLAILSSRKPLNYLWLTKPPIRFAFFSVVLMVVAIPGINLIASFNAELPLPTLLEDLEEKARELTYAFLKTDSVGILVVNIFMVAVLPAIGEELIFRGALQGQLCKLFKSTHWGIFVASLIFSAIHFQFHGFLPRMLLGMLFGYMLVWSGSIWVPILAHFVNNAIAVVAYFFIARGAVSPDIETLGEFKDYWHIGVASLVLASWLGWVLWKERMVDG